MLAIMKKDLASYAALSVIVAAGPILLTYLDGMTRGTITSSISVVPVFFVACCAVSI